MSEILFINDAFDMCYRLILCAYYKVLPKISIAVIGLECKYSFACGAAN